MTASFFERWTRIIKSQQLNLRTVDPDRAMTIGAALSCAGWRGCTEKGDIENCLTFGCPCGEEGMQLAREEEHLKHD